MKSRLATVMRVLQLVLLCSLPVLRVAGAVTAKRRTQTTATVQDVIASNPNLSFLAGALNSSNLLEALSPTGNYTIFAPSNTAFATATSPIFANLLREEYVKHLEDVLYFHLLSNLSVPSSALVSGAQNVTMTNGEVLTINVEDSVTLSYAGAGGVPVSVTVNETDLMGVNGVVHVIDSVLLPSFAFTPLASLTGSLSSAGFETLNQLLALAFPTGLPNGTFTVFAPNDDAFANLPADVLASLTDPSNIVSLQGILSNHVVSGIVPSTFLTSGRNFTSLGGLLLFAGGAEGSPEINGSTVVLPDVLASDGIVHAIDGVILASAVPAAPTAAMPATGLIPTVGMPATGVSPTMAMPVASAPTPSTNGTLLDVLGTEPSLSLLFSGINSSTIGSDINDEGPYTLFAPNNDAFAAVNASFITLILSPPYAAHLENLLLYHVIEDVRYLASDLQQGEQLVMMANDENLTITVDAGSVTLTYPGAGGESVAVNVNKTDLVASNGVAHTIGGVLLPAFAFKSLLDVTAQPLEGYSILLELLGIAFPGGISVPGSLTVLAPDDDAFEALGNDTLATLRDPANSGKLTNILANHVIVGLVPSVSLADGQNYTTFGGLKLNVTVNMGTVMFNDATVDDADAFLAMDGIIHGIDTVLLAETTVPAPVMPPVAGPPVEAPIESPAEMPVAAPTADAPATPPSSSSSMVSFSVVGFVGGIMVALLL